MEGIESVNPTHTYYSRFFGHIPEQPRHSLSGGPGDVDFLKVNLMSQALLWFGIQSIRRSVRPCLHRCNRRQCLLQSSGFCGIIGHALLLIIATIGFQLITSLLPNVTAYSLVEGKLMIINRLPEEAAGPYSCILFLFCSWERIMMRI